MSGSDDTCIYVISFSVVSPCEEYDIMKRPNSDRTIDSTNPDDDAKLSSGGYQPWRSAQPGAIIIKSDKEVRVMRVVIQRVEGTDKRRRYSTTQRCRG